MAFVCDEDETIWAFCLITSAGVRMAQETSSAREDEALWISGWGSRAALLNCGLCFVRRDFTPS